jgi:uncharacterized protein (DUF983 family)
MSLLQQRLNAVVFQRCPHCLRGKVFERFVTMRERCAECEYKFELEPGYFFGAMYASYFLAIPIIALFAVLIHWLLVPTWQLHNAVLIAIIPFLITVPIIFRYSRVVWMHFDHPWVPAVGKPDVPPKPQADAQPVAQRNGKAL